MIQTLLDVVATVDPAAESQPVDQFWKINCVSFPKTRDSIRLTSATNIYDAYKMCKSNCDKFSFGVIAQNITSTPDFFGILGGAQHLPSSQSTWLCSCIEVSDSLPTIYPPENCTVNLMPDCSTCINAVTVRFWGKCFF